MNRKRDVSQIWVISCSMFDKTMTFYITMNILHIYFFAVIPKKLDPGHPGYLQLPMSLLMDILADRTGAVPSPPKYMAKEPRAYVSWLHCICIQGFAGLCNMAGRLDLYILYFQFTTYAASTYNVLDIVICITAVKEQC